MNFKNPFNRFIKKHNSTPEISNQESSSELTGWESVAAMNPDAQSGASFDDLASEPFAGDPGVTDESVTPKHVLPDESPEIATSTVEQESAVSPELQAFKNFFKIDLRIKRELMQSAPRPEDSYDEKSRMDYVDEAYRTFRGFHSDFNQIIRDFEFGDYISETTDEFFRRGEEHFAVSNYGTDVPNQIYRHEFTDLRPAFIEKVKDACVGYTFSSDLGGLVKESQSINELLHAYHSHIMNDENILQKVPPVAEKENSRGYPIVLRGESSALSQQVFDAIPDDLDVGYTDIISADEHVMMMVRDRGHALTISAEPDGAQPDKMWVEYNIPKLCNVEMIKALPGLSGYTDNGARGGFFASRDAFGQKIVDFISQVPMDSDMPEVRRFMQSQSNE